MQFSIQDLVSNDTMPQDLANFFIERIVSDDSIVGCAMPVGGGKTVILESLFPYMNDVVRVKPGDVVSGSNIYAEEISPRMSIPLGRYYWNDDLKQLFRMKKDNLSLCSTMHSDSYYDTKNQLCQFISEMDFFDINILYYIGIRNPIWERKPNTSILWIVDGYRYISSVYYSRGKREHELIYTKESGLKKY